MISHLLCLRIIKICSEPEVINSAIERAKAIPRDKALERVVRNKFSDRPVLVVRYHPALPSVTKITQKHLRTMVQEDPQMKENFPKPPLVAYTRPQTIRQKLIRAKLPSRNVKPKRVINGMFRCKKNCKIFPYVKICKAIKATHTDMTVHIQKNCKICPYCYCDYCLMRET